MEQEKQLQIAADLMGKFGDSTGLTSSKQPRRYLWTDAYAVCNYVALFERAKQNGHFNYIAFLEHAITLVEQVHNILGRHRADERRAGWISGLDEAAGRRHPTAGGLRIGKPLPERGRHEQFDADREWDRDGQYFHYLTKWMHALHKLAQTTADSRYERWARELAEAAFRGFKYPISTPRLVWKMSIDLTYPLVPSSGHHDPLDGLVTILSLRQNDDEGTLRYLENELAAMCRGQKWTTEDPLGIGGLLFDACRLAQLPPAEEVQVLLNSILQAAVEGLSEFNRGPTLRLLASQRLGFRELGLSIGLRGIELLSARIQSDHPQLESLRSFKPLANHIEQYWLTPSHQAQASWTDHEDINEVMLATSLLSPQVLRVAAEPD